MREWIPIELNNAPRRNIIEPGTARCYRSSAKTRARIVFSLDDTALMMRRGLFKATLMRHVTTGDILLTISQEGPINITIRKNRDRSGQYRENALIHSTMLVNFLSDAIYNSGALDFTFYLGENISVVEEKISYNLTKANERRTPSLKRLNMKDETPRNL